jgi:hypothetical protein
MISGVETAPTRSQDRMVRWLIGFFEWMLWLFRRGGAGKTENTAPKNSIQATVLSTHPVNHPKTATSSLHYPGNGATEREAAPIGTEIAKNGDLVVADVSGSMLEESALPGKTKLDCLRDALRAQQAQPRLLAFSGVSWECRGMEELVSKAGGSTNLAGALQHAERLKPIHLLVISDGTPDSEDLALKVAERIANGCIIDALFIGPETDRSGIDFMRRLAAVGRGRLVKYDIGREDPLLLKNEIAGLLGDPRKVSAISAELGHASEQESGQPVFELSSERIEEKGVEAFLERLPEIQRQLLEAETAPRNALAEFMAKLLPAKMELRAALRALRDDYRTMNEMGVHRASKRPKSRFVHLLFMLVFIALEAYLNGSFLAVGSEGGLIAGWTMAGGISFFNVFLLGFTFGAMSVRQLNHHRFHRKLLGALALCAILAVAYSSNLVVAHYRDALSVPDPDNAGAAALKAWLANPVNPLKVSGVQSLWLLGLGIAFTVIGIIDGYRFDDPYPGYGRFYLEHTQRQTDYHSLFQRSFDQLREVAQTQDAQLAELADEINKRLNDFLLLKGRYAAVPEDPEFDGWKRIEEGFPEARANAVLIALKDHRGKILDEYTRAMTELETLDPTNNGE